MATHAWEKDLASKARSDHRVLGFFFTLKVNEMIITVVLHLEI